MFDPQNLYLICPSCNVYENLLLYIVMDQSWINGSRISDVYEKGVEEFLQFAK